jgi:hypothetical protein
VAASFAGVAQAALDPHEMMFYASNGSANSATFDLGLTTDQFGPLSAAASTPGSTITWNLGASTVTPSTPGSTSLTYGSVWSSFAFGSSTVWGVIGGNTTLGDIVSTSSSSQATVASTSGDQANAAAVSVTGTQGEGGVYYPALNVTGTHATAANGAALNTTGNALHFNGFGGNDQWRQNTPFVAGMTGAGSLPFYYLAFGSDGGLPVDLTKYGGLFTLDAAAGTLTYSVAPATVPEPESWALLVAGIVMLGTIARRRMNG